MTNPHNETAARLVAAVAESEPNVPTLTALALRAATPAAMVLARALAGQLARHDAGQLDPPLTPAEQRAIAAYLTGVYGADYYAMVTAVGRVEGTG